MSTNSTSSGSGGGSSGGGGSGGGGPCGACKFLRRKCVPGCIFAPYFDSEQGASHFAAVHKVFGASNVSKLLLNIPMHKRLDAVITICYEAQSRLRDPVYGCVAHIFALQQQVATLSAELSYLQGHLATLDQQPPVPPPQAAAAPPIFSIADLPSTVTAGSSMPAAYDLSSIFDPMTQTSWAMQQHRAIDPRQYFATSPPPLPAPSATTAGSGGGGGDLQALARELLHRYGSPPTTSMPCSNAPSSPSLSK